MLWNFHPPYDVVRRLIDSSLTVPYGTWYRCRVFLISAQTPQRWLRRFETPHRHSHHRKLTNSATRFYEKDEKKLISISCSQWRVLFSATTRCAPGHGSGSLDQIGCTGMCCAFPKQSPDCVTANSLAQILIITVHGQLLYSPYLIKPWNRQITTQIQMSLYE